MSGCGLGLDGPLFDSTSLDSAVGSELGVGWVFELRAPVSLDIGPRILTASWTDVVAIEPDGPRRLGRRPPGLLITSQASGTVPKIAS
jgi:hypothetical protein